MPTNQLLQLLGIAIQLAGLALIVVELYAPRSSSRISETVESVTREKSARKGKVKNWRSASGITAVYVAAWVVGALGVSIWDPTLSLAFNVVMTIFSTLFWLVVLIIDRLLKLSVFVGRGNTIGGVGLVLAIIGLALEIASLL